MIFSAQQTSGLINGPSETLCTKMNQNKDELRTKMNLEAFAKETFNMKNVLRSVVSPDSEPLSGNNSPLNVAPLRLHSPARKETTQSQFHLVVI